MTAWWHKDPLHPLIKTLGKDKVFTTAENLALYGIDATTFSGDPLAVVLAESTEDIQAAIDFARENELSITPRGAGSGLSGGSVPISGGIVLSCERMKIIESVDSKTKTAIVQPGVVTEKFQREVARYKLFYPPDPSSYKISTIGGNVAENAGGLRCFKYGVTSHYVLGIEYVNSEGEVEQTGILSSKLSNPDITSLLIGSEGTLGVFSRIALRLIQIPEKTVTLTALFLKSEVGLESIDEIINLGLTPSVMEYIDRKSLTAAANHIGVSFPDQAGVMLLIEVDGKKDEVIDTLHQIEAKLKKNALVVEVAEDSEDRDRLWNLRRAISPSLVRLATGKIQEDIAVPRGKLAEMSVHLSEISLKRGVEIAVYGHAGDGNLHVVILYSVYNQGEIKTAKLAAQDVYEAAISLGGTITGEHGVGCAKRDYLHLQLSDLNIQLAYQIKKNIDPHELFNPGKIFPSKGSWKSSSSHTSHSNL